MSNKSFGIIAFSMLLGTVGALVALNPRAIPRMANAYYALIHMKSRLAEALHLNVISPQKFDGDPKSPATPRADPRFRVPHFFDELGKRGWLYTSV